MNDVRIRPTRAEIDLSALRHNVAAVSRLAGGKDLLAVVKSNAYGHGAVPVARALEAAGVRFLGVALVEEGIELRHAGVHGAIVVLGGAYAGGYRLLVEHRLTPTVFRPEHLTELGRAARAAGVPVRAHVKVDTGMGRLGMPPGELAGFLALARQFPEVTLEGLSSQLAKADTWDDPLTSRQLSLYQEALTRMEGEGFPVTWRHLSNSAGLAAHPEAAQGVDLNLSRPGLLLYGVSPAPWVAARVEVTPVLSWKTGVVHLKRVPAGATVSYGATWTAPREALIATLPVGYGDGYARSLSNRASVLVRGRRAKVVGRVCMDMIMADVTEIPGAAVGDEVVLLGADGGERITAEELADLEGTISYEVLCAVGARVPRVSVGG